MNRTDPFFARAWMQGWPLLGTLTTGLVLMSLAVLAVGPDAEGFRLLIRVTARSSFVLFLLAFTASAAMRRWPGSATRWQLANRRQLGLGFAVSHTIHAAAIAGFAWIDPVGFHAATSAGNFVSGGLAYAFIALMAATSFDGAVRWLGPKRWRLLHLAGLYFLWVSFMITFGKRVPVSAAYVLPLAVLLAALALRLWPQRRGLQLSATR
jgi:DMSO/TMAO reductase YedYZ heme-binding membrane subunit